MKIHIPSIAGLAFVAGCLLCLASPSGGAAELARMSPKSSTALRYTGAGADFVGLHARASHRCMTTLQGVDPASPAHLLETTASARSPFARDEFCETCGLEDKEETTQPTFGFFEATTLGFVEGITEYLPVSSTGHLILTAHLLDLNHDTLLLDQDGEPIYLQPPSPESPQGTPLTYDRAIDGFLIIIQIGAIAAVILLYWRRLISMYWGLLGKSAKGLKLLRNLVLAFIPAAVVGLTLEDVIDRHLFGNGPVIIALFAGGILILGVERWHSNHAHDKNLDLSDLTPWNSLFIGLLQCVALWPGTSRSLMTILGGYLVRLSPARAAEFSFLLGLATLSAASLYKGYKLGPAIIQGLGWEMPLLACLVGALSAAAAVKWMVAYLSKHGLAVFGIYRIILSLVMAYLFFG